MSKLINNLIREGYLKTDSVIDAFSEIDRIEFVPQDLELQAEANVALPIGYGQTISQPLTVAMMMELLDVQTGNNVLDVGSGSGWTTALLCHIVGKEGKVYAMELVKELMEVGKSNVEKYRYVNEGIASFYNSDGSKGLPEAAPFDRILVSASAQEVPEPLKAQLKVGGKMIIPVKNSVWFMEKKDESDFYKEEYPGFSFVPLIVGR